MDCKDLTIVLVGKTGAGKSSTGNTILKKPAFSLSPTEDCKIQKRKVEHQELTVVDTPGLFGNRLPDDEVKKKIKDFMSHDTSGPLVFLLVIQPKSFTNEDTETGKIIEGIFGKEAARYTIVLFTRKDDLKADGDKIEEIIKDNPALSDFVSHCGKRYCVFNNREKKNTQVTNLLDMINKMVENGNKGRHGTSDRRDDNKRRAGQAEITDPISAQPNKRLQGDHDVDGADKAPKHDFMIILLGKTGAGKSSSGNTILGRKAFKTGLSASTVCEMESEKFDGKSLAVVDTPGLLNTEVPEEQVKREVIECIKAAPGPQVYLVVIKAGRFTKEEEETVKIIQQMFGEEAAGCTMVLFTRGDALKADEVNIEEFINRYSALHDFITQCGGGYHVFNNRSRDPAQVKELLEKINTTVNTIQTTPPADGASPVGGIGSGRGAVGGWCGGGG